MTNTLWRNCIIEQTIQYLRVAFPLAFEHLIRGIYLTVNFVDKKINIPDHAILSGPRILTVAQGSVCDNTFYGSLNGFAEELY